jgi:dephospho-CoA kinase
MDKPPRIIGLSGTNGSGKDTIGQLLADHYGFLFVSVTDILRNELRRRALPVTRENLRQLSAEWRRDSHSLGVLVDKALAVYQEQPKTDKYSGLVMASLRNPGEADRIHQLDGLVVWIDADPKVRYARVQANAMQRGRQGEDNKSYEQFLSEEAAEMNKPANADDAVLNTSAVKDRSDVFIDNASSDKNELAVSLKTVLKLS